MVSAFFVFQTYQGFIFNIFFYSPLHMIHMDLISIITLVAAVTSIIITVWNTMRTNRLTFTNHQSMIFSEFTRRYQDIILSMPDEVFKDETAEMSFLVQKHMMLYFNLCSEEHYLHDKGDIPAEIWHKWVEGIKITTTAQIYRTYWARLKSSYNPEFVQFMHDEIFK